MLELKVAAPWEFLESCKKDLYTGSRILTDPTAIRDFFRRTFMSDQYDDGRRPDIPEYSLLKQVYRDYLRCFHGTEIDIEPFEVESPWILKSGAMHCLADTIYPDILLGMIIIAQSDLKRPVFVNNFNDITLRFLIQRKEKYKVFFSCFSDAFCLIDGLKDDQDDTADESFIINGVSATREVIFNIDGYSITEEQVRAYIDRNPIRNYDWIAPEHYAEMALPDFISRIDGSERDDCYDEWRIRVCSESLTKGSWNKYSKSLRVIRRRDGQSFFIDENIMASEGIGFIVSEIIKVAEDDYATEMLAVYGSEYAFSDYDGSGDIFGCICWYIYTDFSSKNVSIWDGTSNRGREYFYREFNKIK